MAEVEESSPVATMNFAEYKLTISPEWATALKSYAGVKNDMEERPKGEWDGLFQEMKTKR